VRVARVRRARFPDVVYSDKTVAALAKHVQQALAPDGDEDEDEAPALALEAIEACVRQIAQRTNYGLDTPSAARVPPAAVCVWRWELTPLNLDWLPKASREKVSARLAERVQVRVPRPSPCF
jgi:chromatin assembly factor 1 subunit A